MTEADTLPPAPRRPRRLSEILTDMANDPTHEQISFADIRAAMGDRAFGAMMFVFAAPNTLPVNPPGVSVILGVPLLFLSLQLMFGFAVPWLPRAVVQATTTRQRFASIMNYVVPWLRRAERLSRPRWTALATGFAERLIGLLCAILAVVLILPVPFGNVTTAIPVCILCFALLERDGVAALLGGFAGIAALAFCSGVIIAIVKAVSLVVRHWLGI